MFITFEAGEGAGKTTQVARLVETLSARGMDVVRTREPGGTPTAEELRRVLVTGAADRMDAATELLVFTAARRDHVKRLIEPALAAGRIVVCDRFLGSTIALQGAAGEVSYDQIMLLHEAFIGIEPDLTIFLDLDVDTSLARAGVRNTGDAAGEGRFESKGLAYHRDVHRGFRRQCEENPNWVAVDADGSIAEVEARVLAVVEAALDQHRRKSA